MGTEREADRPAHLVEVQRKLAEEEEKRRAAEQSAAVAQGGYYGPLRDTQRQVGDEQMGRRAGRDKGAAEPERAPADELGEFQLLQLSGTASEIPTNRRSHTPTPTNCGVFVD